MLAALAYAPPAGAFSSSAPQPGPPSVNAGGYMTCGLRADNIAACWGANGGAGAEGPGQSTPPAGVTFTEVNSGYSHACGIVTDNTVACWGSNQSGGATPPAGTFTHVAAGYIFSCALRSDATAACWGADDSGQVSNVPVTETFSQLTVGIRHACGLRNTDGTIVCWGSNAYGQVANVPSGTFSDLNSGNFDVCALRESTDPNVDGTAVCWGRNAGNQQATTPAGAFTQISAGFRTVCGLRSDGTVTCWGANGEGQGTPPAGATFNNVSVGTFHSCGMRTDNTAVCWGNNAQGRVAPEMTSLPATPAAAVGTPYSHQFTSTHLSPAVWTVTSGTLPPGLTLSSDGLLSGTPTKGGVFPNITVSVSNGMTGVSETFSIVVAGDPGANGLVNCTVNSLGACVVDSGEELADELTP